MNAEIEEGLYQIEVLLEGGTGKASISSPTVLRVTEEAVYAEIAWSSPYYDYMVVGDEMCYPVNEDGNSRFEIPVPALDEPYEVTADTTAMSVPHEIVYQLTFDSSTLCRIDAVSGEREQFPVAAAGCLLLFAVLLGTAAKWRHRRRDL